MEGIKQIIPANGWTAYVKTDQGEQAFPLAVWALTTDNQIEGLISVGDERSLQPLPSLSVTYKHVTETLKNRSNKGIVLGDEEPGKISLNEELDEKILEGIIAKVEEHLDEKDLLLSPAKKAEIINTLYKEALERDDWQVELGCKIVEQV